MDAAALKNVTLLASSNWELWKIKIKVILMHLGAWQFNENSVAVVKRDSSKAECRRKTDLEEA